MKPSEVPTKEHPPVHGSVLTTLFSMGSAGDPPAPLGDPPSGTGRTQECNKVASVRTVDLTVPSGGSADGPGGPPVPPRLGRHVTTASRLARFAPLWLSGGFVGLVMAVHWAQRWELPFPQCLMRKYTGVPCPTCGCTRSLMAWWDLDLAAAFRFNPLFFVLCLGLLAWFGLWCAERLTGRAWLARWRAQARHRLIWKVFIGLAVVNWLYLWYTLPR